MADSKFSFQEVGRIYEPAWMSPEALSKRPADINLEASDMWSFAVLLWELATREVPFADLIPMECGMKVSLFHFAHLNFLCVHKIYIFILERRRIVTPCYINE